MSSPPNNIKKLRTERGLTQAQVADRIGQVEKQSISRYENGGHPLSIPWMRRFAKVFDCYPSDLMHPSDVRPAEINQPVLVALIRECLEWNENQTTKVTPEMIAKTVAHLYPQAVKEDDENAPSVSGFLDFIHTIKS